MSQLYAADGVNISEGDSFSSFAARVCSATYANSPFVKITDLSMGHFRGPRGFRLHNLPEGCYQDIAPDGVGTKAGVITAALSHNMAAYDILAMTCSDITRWGGLPLMFSSVLDVSTLGEAGSDTGLNFRRVLLGLMKAANKQGIVLFKGETAELGVYVGSDDPEAVTKFNWAGFATGVYHDSKIITGDSLAPGQRVIALREYGFRSNGISSVRKALKIKFGDEWWKNPEAGDSIRAAATPSTLYDKFLATLNGWFNPEFKREVELDLVAHITGGGIKSKFAEDILFPRGLSAVLDNLWDPPDIMQQCAVWRKMSQEECYEVWNGGQGMLLVANQKYVSRIVQLAEQFGIEAKDCGVITDNTKPTLKLHSRFGTRQVLEYTE